MARRWSIALLVVLGLSLAVNFFVFGFVAAGGWHHRSSRVEHYAAIAGLGRAPPPLRHRVEAALRDHHNETHDALQAVRAARRDIRAAMRAEPFDRAKLNAAFGTLRERVDKLQELIFGAVGDAIAATPAAERAQIRPPRHRH
jgi:uncharacterized membrane protein